MILNVLNLGLVPYETALQLQRTLMELRKASRVENTLLLLEHPPVITLGRNAQVSNVLASPESLAQRGVELFEIDRAMAEAGQSPALCLVNTSDSDQTKQADIDAFNALSKPDAPHRVI